MSPPTWTPLAHSALPGGIRPSEIAHLFSEGEEQVSPGQTARRLRREALFRESLPQWLRRQALAAAYALQPDRVAGLLPTWKLLVREAIAPPPGLPQPRAGLANPDGLCGAVRDLSVHTLIDAYARGLYPWCHAGPLKWWAPRTRCVADPRDILVGKAARRHAKRGTFKFTFDRDFDAVIAACAGPRERRLPLTWITPKIMWTYAALHDAGLAHSYEVWDAGGHLVAGGYGVATGRVFVGESMFTRSPGAGAYGFSVLNRHLGQWGFALHDVKLPSEHFRSLGFAQMPRGEYATYLSGQLSASRAGRWQSMPALCALQ
jgi:leucyl/phenylalanyl-tRNA--protein transferase